MRFYLTILLLQLTTIGFGQNTMNEYYQYLYQLNVKGISKYKYIVFYPINHSNANDSHWIQSFINAEQEFRQILFILIIDEPNQLNLLTDYARKRNNLVIDRNSYFQMYSFYSYYPFYFAIEDGQLMERININYKNAYGDKVLLYRRFMK